MMFKKPKRNFRSRRNDSGSDDDNRIEETSYNDSTGFGAKHAVSATKSSSCKTNEKNSDIKKVGSTNSILSFGSEEEADGEVFQVKKPNHSKRLVKQLKKEGLKGKEDDNEVPPVVKFEVSIESSSVKENVKGLAVKKIKKEDPLSEDDDGSHSDEDQKKSGVLMQNILKSGQIPDASLIHLARKRRQLARERGDEFIPLDNGNAAGQGKKSSRLIRDDDDDRSDDSDDDQFAITSRQKDLERRKMEETILAAGEESHSDSDHERVWEEQQIKKGVSIPAQQVPASTVDDYYANYQTYVCGNGISSHNYTTVNVTSVISGYAANLVGITSSSASYEPPKDLPALTVESVKQRLMDRLAEMVGVHRVHQHQRDDLCSRTELSIESIEKHDSQASALEEQYKFFQEMRGYVRDLVECLNEKMTSVNYLDRCMTKLYKENTDKLIKRRQEDVKDQSMEYMPGKATTSALEANVSDDKKRRRADREGRRTRRKRAREAAGIRDHCDGMSTDDELNYSDNAKFSFSRDELTKSAATLFDDVNEDFCQPELILNRFETWRKSYADSYNEAYIGLCLPKLFTPFVKVELAYWNPLEADCKHFETHKWFNSLIFYGWKDASFEPPNDNDLKLVPNLVDKVILPKLTAIVETLWDPLSSRQTLRLISLARRLVEDYPTVHAENKNTQLFIKAVVNRLKKCLDDDIFMPLYPKQILENRTSDASVFFHRQFWTCIKLMQNIVEWHGIVSDRQLMELALDSLLNRYLVIAFQNSVFGCEMLNKLNAIVEAMPKEWFLPYTGDSTLPQLDNLCRCIINVAGNSCSAQPVLSKDSRELIRQCLKLLLTMRARNHAISLANRVHVNLND